MVRLLPGLVCGVESNIEIATTTKRKPRAAKIPAKKPSSDVSCRLKRADKASAWTLADAFCAAHRRDVVDLQVAISFASFRIAVFSLTARTNLR